MKKIILLATNIMLAFTLTVGLSFAAEQKAPIAKPPAEKKIDAAPVKAAAVELVDINSATEEQLKKIAGIGDEYSKKIIAGRPYAKKDQLKSKKIIPAAVYDKIKDKIIAKHAKGDDKKK